MEDISKDILIEASEGNMGAFEQIYRIASGFVFNIVYRITNNKEEAEEATQDVFLKIYRNLKGFHFQSSFKTWIYRIAVNTAINATKRRVRQLSRNIEYDDNIRIESTCGVTREIIDKQSNEELLKSMLNVLNPDQRACVALRDIEGLSYKEIAEALKININTVRSRLKRAREALLAFRQKGVMDNEL